MQDVPFVFRCNHYACKKNPGESLGTSYCCIEEASDAREVNYRHVTILATFACAQILLARFP